MSWITRVLIGVIVVILLAVGVLAWLFRSQAEAIPDVLPAIDRSLADPMEISIPGGDIPDLHLAEYREKRIYFLLEDRESMQAGESKPLNRALARWALPAETTGFMIGDAKGFGIFRSKVSEFMGMMRPEMRLPLYIDFKGAMYDTFKLPRGHSGFVLLDRGEVLFRHSGPADVAVIDRVRELMNASPAELPKAPTFQVGELTNKTCEGRVCLFAFLAEPVDRTDVPGLEGGWEGGREEGFERFSRPSIRLVGTLAGADEKIDEDMVSGAIVGDLKGFEFRRWKLVSEADRARETFGLGQDAGLVVINAEGELAFKASGKIAFWQLGLVADLIGVDLGERDNRP